MSTLLHDPSFWVLIAFVILVAGLARPLARMAAAEIDNRSRKIRAEIEEAEKLREEAQDLLAGYQRRLRDAVKEAEAIVQHAREESARMSAAAAEAIEASIRRGEQQAHDRIARAEARAVAEVRAYAVDLAMDAARHVLAERLSPEKSAALVDATIRDLPKRLH